MIVLGLSAWFGAGLLRRRRPLEGAALDDFRVVQGAILTLLALIIGFTFSMAIGRYDQRKNLEEAEANAIGTEYVRADLLPAADAAKVRTLLRRYTDERILFYTTRDFQEEQKNQCPHGEAAERAVGGDRAGRHGDADAGDGPGGQRHERRAEFAGLHPGGLVEPHPACGVVVDGP